MLTKDLNYQILTGFLEDNSLSHGNFANWLTQDITKQTREKVSQKCRGIVGVTTTEIGLIRALQVLIEDGYDIKTAVFDEVSTKEQRHKILMRFLKSNNLSHGDFANWLTQSITKQSREKVSQKCREVVGVIKADIGLIRALEILIEDGYDIKSAVFDDSRELVRLEKNRA